MLFLHHVIRCYLVVTLIYILSACTSKPAKLDPLVANTGQPLSSVAQSTDVIFYDLKLAVFPEEKQIAGTGKTVFRVVKETQQIELKLDSRFSINTVTVADKKAEFLHSHGVITINLYEKKYPGEVVEVAINYSGKPHIALNPPWSGGFVFSETNDGKPWIATAVQGEGCDLFWPCKDHFSDKADSMRIRVTVPTGLYVASNGVLKNITVLQNKTTEFDWFLSEPASDYNIALNIGPFERVQQQYTSINGTDIPVEFWVLPENRQKASNLLTNDVYQQMAFFESVLGPYPWGQQKLGFVETPHLGMEHQTINAYGKGYTRDPSGYDWLIQHELAHEWFGNLMTHEQLNDAWLHEGFGFYMQPSYSLYTFGEAAYNHAMYKAYLGIKNCQPIVKEGELSSKEAFNSDIYGKGGWTLHTLRWLIGDELFWQATRELIYGSSDTQSLSYPIQSRYRNTQQFIDIVNRITKKDYNWLFDVYLKQAALPTLTMKRQNNVANLYWSKSEKDATPFKMPVPISINGQLQVYIPIEGVITIKAKPVDHIIVDPQMKVLRQLPITSQCQQEE